MGLFFFSPSLAASEIMYLALKFSKSGGMISLDSQNALGDNIFERISAVIIVFCGIQSLFVAFLIDVFTDIRWFLSNLDTSSELTNNYLGHQYRKSQVVEQQKSKGLAEDYDGEGARPEW